MFNKYRPQTFADLIGQQSAVKIITNSIMKSSVSHAYLFSGSRGCGKTSAARIFAKALNCKNPNGYEPCGECVNCRAITAGESLDVIEIDGASNNGVDNIRALKENVTLAPFNSRWKIYIIDEVHMLSTGAFNALLKTLEEPPEYVIFIMATTEPQKVTVTIRSRCQHIPFHSISPEDIYSRLQYVCESENVNAESEALWEISRQADGALRDALSLLEQVIASGDITLQNVERVTGAGSRTAFERWIRTFRTDSSEGYMMLKSMFDSGASGLRVFEEIFSLVRNLWLVSRWNNIAANLGASEQEKAFMSDEIQYWKPEDLHKLLNVIVKMLSEARRGIKPDILLGMFMLYLEPVPNTNTEELSLPPVRTLRTELPEQKEITKPEPPVIEAVKDDALKERMLDTAYSKNFLIYSALLDADVYDVNGELTVRMYHSYCYSWLKVTRHAADLRSIFKDYVDITVCYGQKQFICPDYEHYEPVTSVTRLENAMPEYKPETVAKTQHEAEPVSLPELLPETVPYITPAVNEPSKIVKFISELIRYDAKPEVLMIKKHENENENENESEENNTDNSDNTDEGDNEE